LLGGSAIIQEFCAKEIQMHRIHIIFLSTLLAVAAYGQDGNAALRAAPFLSIRTIANDDIATIMEIYGLAQHECNTAQFLKLNGIKNANAKLSSGKQYKLPIQTMRYNGSSIRTTAGIDNWKTAVAIRDYNHSMQKKGVRDDDFTETRDLWIPWHTINCDKKGKTTVAEGRVPSTSQKTQAKGVEPAKTLGGEPSEAGSPRRFPIFGEKYANTPLLSSKLKGRVFYLISGHGGPDPGAQGKRAGIKLCEDEYAYDVTLRLLKYLLSHGATAYMIVRDLDDGIRDENYLTCDKDEVVWGNKTIPANQKTRLGQRTDIVNALTAAHDKRGETDQTVVEIHVDSRSVATETDVFFYYRPNDEASMNLALYMHQVFIEKYNQKRGPSRRYSGTVKSRDLFTLRETNTPKAVYVELGNIQNDWDQQRIVVKNNRQAVANWIGLALSKR
jgi:N-acetylmuramoyl-L-alanine amidase